MQSAKQFYATVAAMLAGWAATMYALIKRDHAKRRKDGRNE